MEYEFRLQDPTSPETVYLFEAFIGAIADDQAASWRGIFAFASRNGVDVLLLDPAVTEFLGRGTLSLIVGLDAVTNRPTLERLRELEAAFASLSVQVFWNRTTGLFHPKISHVQYRDGRQCVIVGSGNLTPGGLRENFEAYSVLRTSPDDGVDLGSWDRFLAEHADDIRAIDDEALERAARNIARGGGRRRRDVEPDIVAAEEEEAAGVEGPEAEGAPIEGRVLVAQVPAAGGRWHQVHFNREVVERFFRVQPNSTQRVYLQERLNTGELGEQEVRPCVYSETNRNHKIELGSHAGADYPAAGRPVAVFRETQARAFEYMMLMPGDPGHDELIRLTEQLETVGPGLPRVMTDTATVRAAWPDCPLV